MIIDRFLIRITAWVFALYGLGFVVAPAQLSQWVSATAPTTAIALTDMRATYGGMSLAVGMVLYVLASSPQTVRLGLQAVMIFMLAMAGGRIVGLVSDASASAIMFIYLALEIIVAVVASILLRREPSS